MKIVTQMAAQGDVVFRKVGELPKGAKEIRRQDGKLVVAHSETGHHHVVSDPCAKLFSHPTDPMLSFLKIPGTMRANSDGVDVEHLRPWDTHETLKLLGNITQDTIYEIRRQREWVPEGWRRVED